ncbi:MAG TPA: hypothetical protein PKV96_02130 [Candidatus Saccharimonas sp.]|nr:hypothetical protein [Candidatus Saccharimonas sp.]
MTAIAGWQDLAPHSGNNPAARIVAIEAYLNEHGDTLDPLERRRAEGHLARAVEIASALAEEREKYLKDLPHTD